MEASGFLISQRTDLTFPIEITIMLFGITERYQLQRRIVFLRRKRGSQCWLGIELEPARFFFTIFWKCRHARHSCNLVIFDEGGRLTETSTAPTTKPEKYVPTYFSCGVFRHRCLNAKGFLKVLVLIGKKAKKSLPLALLVQGFFFPNFSVSTQRVTHF